MIPKIVYTNSLLATLNARKKLRDLSDEIENTSAMENVSVSLKSLGRGHASDFSSSQVGFVVIPILLSINITFSNGRTSQSRSTR